MAIRFGLVEDCVLFIQRGPATDEEWGRYIEFLRRTLEAAATLFPGLVVSDSGPTPKQRKLLEGVSERHASMRVAVITDSTFARGVTNALSMVRPTYRAFSSKDTDAALAYLKLRPSTCDTLKLRIREWLAELEQGG
jgi:hypothetical protein